MMVGLLMLLMPLSSPVSSATPTPDVAVPETVSGVLGGREAVAAREPTPGWPWAALADCESSGDPTAVSPAGHRGWLQWHPDTWADVKPDGAPADPVDASPAVEVEAAETLMARPWGGWHHWPVCSVKVGLRR